MEGRPSDTRVDRSDVNELGRYLELGKQRFLYEQDPLQQPHLRSLPRFLDGSKLDEKMQPVIDVEPGSRLASG